MRRLSLVMAHEQLRTGFDVVVGQYLPETPFLDDLERLAADCGAQFHEYVLGLDPATLAVRLQARATGPDRPEHGVNNRLLSPDDAVELVRSLDPLREARPTPCGSTRAGH